VNTQSSGFDTDLGPDADNYLQDLTPQQGSPFMYEYFYGDDDDSKDNCDKNAKGELQS